MYWFYYDKNGKKIGPVSSAQLKFLARIGEIQPETKIETDSGKISTAGNIKGLVFKVVALPVPPDIPPETFVEVEAEDEKVSREFFDEPVLYSGPNIKITPTRIIIGKTVYSLRNITSVRQETVEVKNDIAIEKKPNITTENRPLSCMATVLFLLTLFFLYIPWVNLCFFILFIVIIIAWALQHKDEEQHKEKDKNIYSYNIHLTSASGETNVYHSKHQDRADEIFKQINKAIINYGK